MGRRKSILQDLIELPWQFGAIGAAVVFVLFQILQATVTEGMAAQALRPLFKILGWGLPAGMLFASLISFLRQLGTKRKYDNTRSLDDIRSLSWQGFESFMGEHFRREGYFVVETPKGPDGGVDLVLRRDGEKTYVQCKQWKVNQVGVEKVRELLGSMTAGGAQNGIFVTSGRYTQAARTFANDCGIRLIDGDELAALRGPEQIDCLTPFLAQEQEPLCPKCSAPMVKRVAKKGSKSGKEFWGCPSFPGCRGTREVGWSYRDQK